MANRFKDLLSGIPRGDFYANDGVVLPVKSGLHRMRFQTDEPDTQYSLVVNDVYQKTVTTDANGVAVFDVALFRGSNTIELTSTTSGRVLKSWATCRNYATWYAAYAEVLEGIDRDIEKQLLDARLDTAGLDTIEDIWGRVVGARNVGGYELETYRDVLRSLRLAYRTLGSSVAGIDEAVAAYTQFRPLSISRRNLAKWVLGADFLPNYDLQVHSGATPDWCVIGPDTSVAYTPVPVLSDTAPEFLIGGHTTYIDQMFRQQLADWTGLTAALDVCLAYGGSSSIVACLAVSFDDRETWHRSDEMTVDPRTLDNPQRLRWVFKVAPHAPSTAWARLYLTAVTPGSKVTVMRMSSSNRGIGKYLGSGTIPRSTHRAKRAVSMLVWSPSPLTRQESDLVGISSLDGHIQRVGPAHSVPEPTDVSEYIGSTPVNMVGAWDEVGFEAGKYVGMELVLRTPERFTFLRPSVQSDAEVDVIWSAGTPVFDLPDESTGIQSPGVLLLEDGVPLTNDKWEYVSPFRVRALFQPSPGAVYTLKYKRAIYFETDVLQLPASYTDYVWFADWRVAQRREAPLSTVRITANLVFNNDAIATIPEPSNMDRTRAVLRVDNGTDVVELTDREWAFLDSTTVRISPVALDTGVVYTLEYDALVSLPEEPVGVRAFHRSAATPAGVADAEWAPFEPNDMVDTVHAYHQLRIELSDVRSPDDAHLQVLGIKGVRAFAGSGIPGVGALEPPSPSTTDPFPDLELA